MIVDSLCIVADANVDTVYAWLMVSSLALTAGAVVFTLLASRKR